jgi:hypothetical protein
MLHIADCRLGLTEETPDDALSAPCTRTLFTARRRAAATRSSPPSAHRRLHWQDAARPSPPHGNGAARARRTERLPKLQMVHLGPTPFVRSAYDKAHDGGDTAPDVPIRPSALQRGYAAVGAATAPILRVLVSALGSAPQPCATQLPTRCVPASARLRTRLRARLTSSLLGFVQACWRHQVRHAAHGGGRGREGAGCGRARLGRNAVQGARRAGARVRATRRQHRGGCRRHRRGVQGQL